MHRSLCADLVKTIRKRLGETQAEFAKRLAVSPSMVSAYEHRRTRPREIATLVLESLAATDRERACARAVRPHNEFGGVLSSSRPPAPALVEEILRESVRLQENLVKLAEPDAPLLQGRIHSSGRDRNLLSILKRANRSIERLDHEMRKARTDRATRRQKKFSIFALTPQEILEVGRRRFGL